MKRVFVNRTEVRRVKQEKDKKITAICVAHEDGSIEGCTRAAFPQGAEIVTNPNGLRLGGTLVHVYIEAEEVMVLE